MNGRFIKQLLQYALSLAIALVVLWYVLRDVEVEEMLEAMAGINYLWVILSLVFAFISYVLRAWRWNLLLGPLGYRPTFGRTFRALMIGYLANLALPRLGEIMRCGVLKKTDEVPVSASLGTVLAERVIDFFFLLGIVAAALIFEINRLEGFLIEIFGGQAQLPAAATWGWLLLGLLLLAGLGWWIWRSYRELLAQNLLFRKVKKFMSELLTGVLSVRKVEQPLGFWLSTILIWIMYYLMTYVIVFSLPQTAGMDLMAGLSILAMGGIGMAAPVQGGLGTYHLLVSGVLMIYGASRNEAVLLAFVLHTSQTFFVIVVGLIALIGFLLIRRKNNVSVRQM